MFTFFHKKPVIHVDCFTYFETIYEMTPIVNTIKTVPDWWKNLKRYHTEVDHDNLNDFRKGLNAKSCYGFLELYKRGLVIESWCDMSIIVTPQKFKFVSSYGMRPVEHPRSQIGEGFKNWQHIKLSSPWKLSEKTGVKFVWIATEWALDNYDFKILPGILDYRIQKATNVNIMLPSKNIEYRIDIGQPLVQIIPLQDDKRLEYKNHLIDKQEWDKKGEETISSFFGWRTSKKIRDRNDEREKKCPFGFGDK